MSEFQAWLLSHGETGWHWLVKRLAANDTHATGSNQVGPYIPNRDAFALFPTLLGSDDPNPKILIDGVIDSHGTPNMELAITWYRAKKNECHLTRWGGRSSPILDPDATGSVVIFAFHKESDVADADFVAVWICNLEEEEHLIDQIGPIEPGRLLSISHGARSAVGSESSDEWANESIPKEWRTSFPSGEDIIVKCIHLQRLSGHEADERLLRRRNCEFSLFRSIEALHVLPKLREGFQSVDEFVSYSHSVNNRRKSRSGKSLELHVKEILREERIPFSHNEVSEDHKRPDFLIPSAKAYRENRPPLWMLATKTTCKDRWRQVLNEADGVPRKHLLTLQEGISENQFKEMRSAGLTLIAPRPLHKKYPSSIRPQLKSVEEFISTVRAGLRV